MSRVTRRRVKSYVDACRNLPEPDVVFTTQYIADRLRIETRAAGHKLRMMHEVGIVTKESRSVCGITDEGSEWSTNEDAFEVIQDVLSGESDSLLPCGHNGFVNLGDQLQCKVCKRRHGRSVVSSDA